MFRTLSGCALVVSLLWGCATTEPVLSPAEKEPVAKKEPPPPAKKPVAEKKPAEAKKPTAPKKPVLAKPADVTLEKLLGEMTDLANLTQFPKPAYTCKQFSSYDQRSTDPSVKTEENWFANGDRGQHLRVETTDGRKEYVMMDAAGPGAVVRIWSANPKDAGTLRVYLDGNKKPALEVSMIEFLTGKVSAFPKPITGMRGRGCNAYFPIPYAKHCKVTADKKNFYYQINYRTYAAGTAVETLAMDQVKALKGKIADVAKKLASPMEASAPSEEAYTEEFETSIPAGEEGETMLYGPSAIVELQISLEADDIDQALRDLIFEVEFDDKLTVACPMGDFFGSAPGIRAYASLPFGVTKDGEMIIRWVMPFKETATLRARNLGNQDIGISGHVTYEDFKWTDRTMYFHAKWRIQRDIPTRPFIDWNYVTATGKGVYVGDALYVANARKNWWGEGDEKIFVDGEKFPSHFGTGTEDYYGYAWCNTAIFHHAYHNQPRCDGPGNYGFTAVNRWHILDAIPFTKSFKFDMEVWHSVKNIKVTYAQVSYWYATADAKDNYKEITEEDLPLPKIPKPKVRKVKGAIEGEKMRVIAKTAELGPQTLGERFSNEQHLWWRHPKVGDKLALGFKVEKPGKYKVVGEFCKAFDYGKHQLSINGVKAGKPIDFFNNEIIPSGPKELGTFELKAGENTLIVECVGTNPKANPKAYMFGLDYLLLKAAS